jgi:hypothetical protein
VRRVTVFSLGAIVLVVAGFGLHRVVRITPDSWVSTLHGKAPPGTAAPRLLAVLDAMGAEHSQPIFAKHGDSEFRDPGRRIYAAVRDLRRGELLADGVFLTVSLDVEDRVVDYRARYVYTGP